jgi:ACS family tartrate transporter-like MFS transporter
VVTGPLTGYIIVGLEGCRGLHGWQWVFIVQGLPSVLVGIAVLWLLPDRPRDARWLTTAEADTIEAAVERDRAAQPASAHISFRQALVQTRLWILVGLYFLLITGFYGVGTWLPTFWKKVLEGQNISTVNLGWILALPYAVTGLLMVLWGRHSDRTGERCWHAASAALVAAVCLAACGFAPNEKWVVLPLMTLATAGTFCALAPFWSMATEYLRGSSAAGGIAMVNGLGCLGGFAGPNFVPLLQKASKDANGVIAIDYAYLALAGSLLLFAALTAWTMRRR